MAESSLFRGEAVAALEGASSRGGAPLLLMPAWTTGAYWFVVLLVGAAVLFAALAPVGEYAEGPAIVRVEGRLDLTTAVGGLVVAVQVRPGATVTAGQRLVQLHSESEQQRLAELDRELELKLVRLLTHPADEGTRQGLATLRAEREQAAARLRERAVIAPRAGVVRNLRIRPGQLLAPGDPVLSLVDERRAAYSVVALVPGQFRPLLRPGLPVRFTLEGYAQVHDALQIESVGDEAVGPSEVRRTLGQEVADTVAVQGAQVLVRARLPRPTFSFGGQAYRYYYGIPGRVDIRVRSVRLAVLIFPPLRGLFDRGR